PAYVAIDASGNVYITDVTNDRIREVNRSTGIITTIAGNGTQGFSGDGGLATAAELNEPAGLALDASGNLYIADSENNRIRKVNLATGIITTIAGDGTQGFSGDGGPATAAELNDPIQIALDASGNLYFADGKNDVIREVNRATGIITTVAGTGSAGFGGDGGLATAAEFDMPAGVALDASGNLFIADSGNNRIREVNRATGIITTVAGNGTSGYKGDGGSATAAELRVPFALTFDASGN